MNFPDYNSFQIYIINWHLDNPFYPIKAVLDCDFDIKM